MKLEWNEQRVNRLIGMSMAAAVIVSCNVAAQISHIKTKNASVTTTENSIAQSAKETESEPVIIPFHEDLSDGLRDDSRRLYQVYSEIVKSEKEKQTPRPANNQKPEETVSSSEQTESTTTTTLTTVPTTASSSVTSETSGDTASEQATVSNGKQPFNHNDVSSIAAGMRCLSDFVDQLAPIAFSWDTSKYTEHGYVQITLTSPSGSITLDVKPVDPQEGGSIEPYTVGGEVSGTVSVNSLVNLDWYRQNRESGCGIRSVTWLKPGFAVEPVRGIDVGAGLAELTDRYLCVNGGATTLYKASDVIENEEKLKRLSSGDAYTFVGGRLYTIGGYLEKYYNGQADDYVFADSDMIVQYGCNSLMDYNYASGSWIIEYAIQDDAVAGICFMNKSYYKKSQTTSTSTTASVTETTAQERVSAASVTDSSQVPTTAEEIEADKTSGASDAVTQAARATEDNDVKESGGEADTTQSQKEPTSAEEILEAAIEAVA